MSRGFLLRVLVKAGMLLVACNLLFALTNPLPLLGRLSVYNRLLPGRERLPYSENAALSYNLSLNNLNAMFASHQISHPKADDEYRVVLLGDSSVWGFLLEPQDTLAGHLNAADLSTPDSHQIRVYNLGYPTMSLTKDLLLLDQAMHYDVDLIIWLCTLESFPRHEQIESPLVYNNPTTVRDLITRFDLDLPATHSRFIEYEFPQTTLIGQRRALADLLRLQTYGVMWMTTGIDQYYPDTYQLRQSDFDENIQWKGRDPQRVDETLLAFDVLAAGFARRGNVPMLLINEPMFISDGENSDLRYNYFYPRWVYDDYRQLLAQITAENSWPFHDLWDTIAPDEFTDSPVHLTPAGNQQLSELIAPLILAATAP